MNLRRQQLDKNGMAVIGIRTNCCPWQKSYRSNDYGEIVLICVMKGKMPHLCHVYDVPVSYFHEIMRQMVAGKILH